MEFAKQEWVAISCSGGIELASPVSPALAGKFFTTVPYLAQGQSWALHNDKGDNSSRKDNFLIYMHQDTERNCRDKFNQEIERPIN